MWETPAFLSWSEGQQVSVSLAGPQSVPVFPVPALGLLLAFLSAAGITARRRAMRALTPLYVKTLLQAAWMIS